MQEMSPCVHLPVAARAARAPLQAVSYRRPTCGASRDQPGDLKNNGNKNNKKADSESAFLCNKVNAMSACHPFTWLTSARGFGAGLRAPRAVEGCRLTGRGGRHPSLRWRDELVIRPNLPQVRTFHRNGKTQVKTKTKRLKFACKLTEK